MSGMRSQIGEGPVVHALKYISKQLDRLQKITSKVSGGGGGGGGDASAANQVIGNNSLSSIDTKTPALVAGRQPVDGSGVTQPVSASSLPLPTGASTSANQTTTNSSLSSIDTKLTSQATAANQTTGNNSLSSIDTKLTSQSTATNQTTGNNSLASIDSKLTSNLLDNAITGQGTQTVVGQNIILAAAGTGSTDGLGYRSVSIQIVPTGTVSSGVVSFEASNDNTNFVPLLMYDDASATANPVTSVSPATGVSRFFSSPLHFRYFRARISTVIGGGGSLQAFTVLRQTSFSPDIYTITQQTAANLNATVTGTVAATIAATATNIAKNEDAVHSNGDTGVYVLSVRSDTPATGVSANGDYGSFFADSLGKTWVNNAYASPISNGISLFRTTSLVAVGQTVKASAGSLYGMTIMNTNTTAVYVKFYNTGTITVGTTPIIITFAVPAGVAGNPGMLLITPDVMAILTSATFTTAIGVSATGAIGDADTTAVTASTVLAQIYYA